MTRLDKGRAVPFAEKVEPGSTALIVVDVQNDFCHPDGYHAKTGADMSMMPAMAESMRTLVAAARDAGALVVWVRATYDEIFQGAPLGEQMTKGGNALERCREGSWGADWYDDLRPREAPNELIVTKHRYSAFWDTEIDLYLRSNGIGTVVVAGVITSGCVESTARDAFFRNYYVVLPGDASGSYARDRHDASLRKMGMTMADVTTARDVAAAWQESAPGARGWQLEAKKAMRLNGLEALVDPAHTAFLIVDLQNDFCHSDGLMGRRGEGLAHNRSILPAVRETLGAARRAGVMVVHIQAQYGPTSGTSSWLFGREQSSVALDICLPGSWGAEQVEELAPLPGEAVVVKHRYSAFLDTALDSLLRSNGIRSVVIVGTATQACVESTVRDAKMRDYYVVVPSDCVAARDRMRQMHDASLEVMGAFFATVAPSSDVKEIWRRDANAEAAQ